MVNKDLLEKDFSEEALEKMKLESDLLVVNEDYLNVIEQQSSLVDWYEVDKFRVEAEKERDDELYQNELQQMKCVSLKSSGGELALREVDTKENTGLEQRLSALEVDFTPGTDEVGFTTSLEDTEENTIIEKGNLSGHSQETKNVVLSSPSLSLITPIEITLCFENKAKKYTTADFTSIFLSRFKYLEKILRNRQDLSSTMSIERILKKKEKEQVSIIGIIHEIGTTKNGNLIAKVEDPTGIISVLFSKNKGDLFTSAKDLILDEVVGISGMCQGDIIFAENIVWPDLPITTELKRGPEEEYVIFLSDFHVGSKLFLKEEFNKFLEWINSRAGNEKQREIASKVKYIIMSGDAVDGVGIYPGQEDELELTDIKEQYAEFARFLRLIPPEKQMILCPGNHDVVHLAEPQPVFYREFCEPLFTIPNLQLVSNPAIVNIGKKENFSGFDILMYHGYSFDYYVANVDSIRNGGGYNRADLIMKFLLKRRHLAPSFKSTPYFPGHSEDPLLIRKIPDIFVTGHIHYCSVADYKGVTMISGSCWQEKTTFQEKLGHSPQPARVPLVNLKTRQVKILRFN
ncbi:DNA-directed DNA polymerase II small subunit [Candidatus Woesearchaeota archaeon]|nr:DNA-directed DNA polymerase II small subunit [Candidatus Woesearchaeota archaeon]